MTFKNRSTFVPLIFAGALVALYVILERLVVPPVKEAGITAHYGLPFIWSFIITLLLWISLERAHVLPQTLSLRSWVQQEWSPAHVYGILSSIFILSLGLAAYFYLRNSKEFLFPMLIASFSSVPLLFYWLYRTGALYLVVGILSLALGAAQLVVLVIGGYHLEHEAFPMLLLSFFIVYAMFFFYAGFVLIRKWRRPAGMWQGSWRSLIWGYLLIMCFSFIGMGIMSMWFFKRAFVALIPIAIYFFLYSLGKFLSSVRKGSSKELIASYTETTSLKNFVRFTIADRAEWEQGRQGVKEQKVTLASLTRSLFDALAFLGIVAAGAVFQEASVSQQLSFGFLVISFHLAATLSEYSEAARDTVAQVRTRLEQELKVAHDMQMGLMPRSDPVVSGFDIAAACIPANEVGGDFYDYVWLDEKKTRLGIAVADVSGKAMKAAMTAVLTSGMLYSEVQKNASPRTVLRSINHPLYLRSDKRVFTALAFAVIDLKTRGLTYSCAGQTPPMLVRKGKVEELKVKGLRLPLGIKDDLNYGELKVRLAKGDLLVFYTDGVVEAMNAEGDMYGFERLTKSLLSLKDVSAALVRDNLLAEITSHTGNAPQHDDMTIVAVRVL